MVGLKLLANRLVLADSRDLGFRIERIEPRRIPLMQRVIQIPIPAMNTTGDLPEGIHSATLEEILAAFGNWNRERGLLFQRLERIYRIAARTGHLARFDGEQATIEFWQTKRDGGRRGIIEILENSND